MTSSGDELPFVITKEELDEEYIEITGGQVVI